MLPLTQQGNRRQHRLSSQLLSPNSAFSLVEVMIAILILGVALVGLTQGITTALSSSKETELQTTAALLAAAQIETLRAEGYLTEGETEGEGEDALSHYRWKQSITSTTFEGLYEVKVVVENAQSGQAIYELQTMLFEAPISSTLSGTSPAPGTGGYKKKERREP